jgi:hypothetical protein
LTFGRSQSLLFDEGETMQGQERILLVSWDPRILVTQSLILGAYFQVETAARAIEVKLLLDRHRFDLIVICSTISNAECEKIVSCIQAFHSRMKILRLGLPEYMPVGLQCVCVTHEDGPLCILKASAELLGFELKSRGRMVRTSSPLPPPRTKRRQRHVADEELTGSAK